MYTERERERERERNDILRHTLTLKIVLSRND